jgi:hypothetical protein
MKKIVLTMRNKLLLSCNIPEFIISISKPCVQIRSCLNYYLLNNNKGQFLHSAFHEYLNALHSGRLYGLHIKAHWQPAAYNHKGLE